MLYYIQLYNNHIISDRSGRTPRARAQDRRRENMVGVNMVLAEFIKFKRGLYKSCGIEWFQGTMLEPCLLQPCLHVAQEEPAALDNESTCAPDSQQARADRAY